MLPDIVWIPDLRGGLLPLGIMARPRGGDWLDDEIRDLRLAGVDVLVSLLTPDEVSELQLTSESELCAGAGIEFVSFPIADRGVPPDAVAASAVLDRLASLVRRDRRMVCHCRIGIGRSSLVAVSVAARIGQDSDATFDALALVRGRAYPDTPHQREWVRRQAHR